MLRQAATRLICRTLLSSNAELGVRAFADDANLKKTVLYDLHVENGGAMHLESDLHVLYCCVVV
jgi:hypothetical protein